ncbi:MAG: SDR family NAD(P)-dependent oxidoreductase [Parahaliea sp.]
MPKKTQRVETSVALVTGASAGIGVELARVFAEHGHDLILVARRLDRLDALAQELAAKHGIATISLAADLAEPDSCEQLCRAIDEAGIQVDVLVNNAGVLYEGPFQDSELEDNLQLLRINVMALTELTQRLLPGMLGRRCGRILNVASTSAFQPIPGLATYAASKAYVLSLSEALSSELKGSGVTVTTLCPGFTATDMIVREDGGTMKVPLVRVMTAREVAQEGYDACVAGKPLWINGLGNRTLVEMGRLQPRWLLRLLRESSLFKGF